MNHWRGGSTEAHVQRFCEEFLYFMAYKRGNVMQLWSRAWKSSASEKFDS